MFSAMLLAISVVALSQFALYYWRAVLAGVAAQPVSDRVLVAAQIENGRFTPQDFQTLAGLHNLTPDLFPNRSGLERRSEERRVGKECNTERLKASMPSLPTGFPFSPLGVSASASSAPDTPPFRSTAAFRPISTS